MIRSPFQGGCSACAIKSGESPRTGTTLADNCRRAAENSGSGWMGSIPRPVAHGRDMP